MRTYKMLSAVLAAALAFVLLSGQGGKKEPQALVGRSLTLVDEKGRTYAVISDDDKGWLAFGLKHPSGATLAVVLNRDFAQLDLTAAKGQTVTLNAGPKTGGAMMLQDGTAQVGMQAKPGETAGVLMDAGKVWRAVPK